MRFRLCAVAIACVAGFVFAAVYVRRGASAQDADARVREEVGRALESFDALSLDSSSALKEVRAGRTFSLATSRGTFELVLEPHDIRAANYRAVAVGEDGVARDVERTPSRTYKGTVRGMDGARARFTIDEERIEGLIIANGELLFVEPARNFSASAEQKDYVFYAGSSVRADSFGECGVTLADKVGAEAARIETKSWLVTDDGDGGDEVFAPRPEAELATEADFEYFQALGSVAAANNEIASIVNQVDGIYETQIGIDIRIVFQRVWATNTDPYTQTNAEAALDQFRSSYNGSFAPGAPPARDITHMWTGKNLADGVAGIAFSSTVCVSPSSTFGISERVVISPQKVALSAHEIGHNFSASHVNIQNGGDCQGSIMSPSLTASTNFCQFSRDEITNHAASNGACLARVFQPGCSYLVSPASQNFGPGGGSGSVNITAGAGCIWGVAEGASWLTITSGETGSGPGATSFTVAPNTGGPRTARADVAGQTFEVRQSPSANCGQTPIASGQTLNGELGTADCRSGQPDRPNAFIDLYTFAAFAGQRVRVEMSRTSTSALDTYLYLYAPDGTLIGENDDIVLIQDTNSRIPVQGFLTLPAQGNYLIVATSFDNDETGAYTLRLTIESAGPNSVSFGASSFAVSEGVGGDGIGFEGTGFRTINVTRTGDISGPATVDYATSDVTADRRKDYTQALGTLRFAPNDASESFTVFVTDDVFQEGAETLNVTLSNPVGTTLGGTTSAVVTIGDNDAVTGANPVRAASFNPRFFVRQHYLDFFTREPDPGGMAFWTDQTTNCGNPNLEICRINVSAAFFLSIEFQETGFLVYRMYDAAYGDISAAAPVPVRLNEFLPDSQRIGLGVVIGQPGAGAQLEANKTAFAQEFVARTRFTSQYPLSLTPAQFVDALNARAGGVLSASERQTQIDNLTNAGNTPQGRAAVLRAVAEDADLTARERNQAFVLMQYFGYLRRNPDEQQPPDYSGYMFWLGKLNEFNGNFVSAEMVKSFLVSGEYLERFGP